MTNEIEESFSNKPIEYKGLPTLEQLDFTPLSPTYIKVHRQLNLVVAICIVLILFIALKQPFFDVPFQIKPIIIGVIWFASILGIMSAVYCYFADPQKGYSLRELDLSYKSGLIFCKVVTQPILRIQHVELKRGPIDRKYGLAKLQIFSAGGALHTFEIPGLEAETAETIRQFILSHKDINVHG